MARGTHIVNQSGQGEEGGPLGALLEGLGVLLGLLGGVLGPSWGPLGALLGASWEPWRAFWGNLGGNRAKEGGGPSVPSPLWGHQDSLLGPSWSPLGALLGPSWGPLGPLLGPSWAISWGHLEASEAHRTRNGEKAKLINAP